MSNNYFTTEELAAETEKLQKQGKPMWAIAAHPKCPPDVAAKMLQLQKLASLKTEGGRP